MRKRQQILRRRIRNRESMRRMRARFKGAKEQLRDLETKLKQHKRRSASSQANQVVAITPGGSTPPQVEQTNAVLAAAIRQKLFELQQAELQLAQEQVALHHQLAAHEQSVKGIRSALQDLHFDRHEMCHPQFLPSTLGGSTGPLITQQIRNRTVPNGHGTIMGVPASRLGAATGPERARARHRSRRQRR